MISSEVIRRWRWAHEWSSMVCTAFLLMICLTGLPLIFADEIDHLTKPSPVYAPAPAGAPGISIDLLTTRTRHMFPGQIVTSVFMDDDEPQVYVWMAPSFAAVKDDPRLEHFVRFDAHSGRVIEQSKAPGESHLDFMTFVTRLHTDLFVGLPGELFLGVMGLLFVVAVVSGVVLYGPFTRKLDFGAIRTSRKPRTRWLDLHNLLGIATLAWALVAGATGVMNELSAPLFAIWQRTDVKAMVAPWQGKPPPRPDALSSPQGAVNVTLRALPDMTVTSIVFPGGEEGSPHHYLLWAHGKSPFTKLLFSPVLVDARSGVLTAVVRMPWYLRTLEIARPLHFGDYGGSPLKILWALFDLLTIAVLGSGLYLWIAKRRERVAVSGGFRPGSRHLEAAE